MRIAVVGSGISGLTAAYLLAPHAEVTLYEKEARLGGHANTAHISWNNRTIAVDTGFMVFNPEKYPNFISLLSQLNVPTLDTNMSFSVSIPDQVEYSGTLSGIMGNIRQLLRPTYLKFLLEIPRFNAAAKAFLQQDNDSLTIRDFLDQRSFSKALAEWYLFPMIGSIWSAGIASIDDFPARETFLFLDNHQLLSIQGGPQWKTIPGGSKTYVTALTRLLCSEGVRVLTNQRIKKITRTPVCVHADTIETYDAVILATHADEALMLLADSTQKEQEILGSFVFTRNTAVLHRDTSVMPKRHTAWAAWNYHAVHPSHKKHETLSLTYNMNLLQSLPNTLPLFVTLNPHIPISEECILGNFEYFHPLINSVARAAQKKLAHIQGVHNTYFVGAYLNNGFHEDGMVSAIEVVKKLNFPIRLTQ